MSEDSAVATVEAEAPAESSPPSLFRYAIWVHVGAGAEDCTEVDEQTGENRCSDSGHFHGFCRLPNQFQERDIRERAAAAKARKLRQLRTKDTDAFEILESGLEDVRVEPDAEERLANELVGYDWTNDYLTAVRQVRDLDDESEGAEEGEKIYAHVDKDRARYAQLQSVPEEERDDEYKELAEHLKHYEVAVQEHYEAIANPKRESYQAMAESDLVDLVRRKRMQFAAQEEFMNTFNVHEWLSCTYRQPDGEPHFADVDALRRAHPDVLRKLDETFADLERTAQEALGN